MGILSKYIKNGVVQVGDDNKELDTPTFEIRNISINTVDQYLEIEILHEVQQGSVTQSHSRTKRIEFGDLPAPVKGSGKSFLESIESEILKLPAYSGATKQ